MLEIAAKAGEGHLPSSYSVLELIWTLHDRVMSADDLFVLSKGHAALALYVVLNEMGVIPDEALDEFCKPGAKLLGHPEKNPAWQIQATTGSLGHGFPMACGMAMGKKIKKEDGRIFCLVGDSELEEGSCWESAHLASRHSLSNLVLLIDANGNSPNRIDGRAYQSDLGSKFAAFGWGIYKVDGHHQDDIARACQKIGGEQPVCIIARTVKGRGIAQMESDPQKWHHKTPDGETLATMKAELSHD